MPRIPVAPRARQMRRSFSTGSLAADTWRRHLFIISDSCRVFAEVLRNISGEASVPLIIVAIHGITGIVTGIILGSSFFSYIWYLSLFLYKFRFWDLGFPMILEIPWICHSVARLYLLHNVLPTLLKIGMKTGFSKYVPRYLNTYTYLNIRICSVGHFERFVSIRNSTAAEGR